MFREYHRKILDAKILVTSHLSHTEKKKIRTLIQSTRIIDLGHRNVQNSTELEMGEKKLKF